MDKNVLNDDVISTAILKASTPQAVLHICQRLRQMGHAAWVVGGCVRDQLLAALHSETPNRPPGDWDIATSARPDVVMRAFPRVVPTGLEHGTVTVILKGTGYEVTTFRAEAEYQDGRRPVGVRFLDDIAADLARRDFTVNALYYNPVNGELMDFANGLEDLDQRVLRIIGNPSERYTEDPVRMLRAVRFAAKLGFRLDPDSARPIEELCSLIAHVPPARLFEEILKLLLGGSATATFELLRQEKLLPYLFPGLDQCLQYNDPFTEQLVQYTLLNTDKRIRQNRRVTPAFIYAAFLWPPLQRAMQKQIEKNAVHPAQAMQYVSQDVVGQQLACTAIPKRFLIPMREIWNLQWRLIHREGSKAAELLQHPRFRAAYDFLILREQAGEDLNGLGHWWTQFQSADEVKQTSMLAELGGQTKRRKPRRRRRKPKTPGPDSNA